MCQLAFSQDLWIHFILKSKIYLQKLFNEEIPLTKMKSSKNVFFSLHKNGSKLFFIEFYTQKKKSQILLLFLFLIWSYQISEPFIIYNFT